MNRILIPALALLACACKAPQPNNDNSSPAGSISYSTDTTGLPLEERYPNPSSPDGPYHEPTRAELDSIALANALPFTPDTTLSRAQRLAEAARSLENNCVQYDPSYVEIGYPGGDVPPSMGVCTDVLIRAMRRAQLGDLQVLVHEFRQAQGKSVDTHIDHRRVRNLMAYLDAQPDAVNRMKEPYEAGRILIWNLGWGQLHVGVMVSDTEVIHNYCCGQNIEPVADQSQWKLIRSYQLQD